MLRWRWNGVPGNSHYYWEIDDISIQGGLQYEVELTQPTFYHYLPNIYGPNISYTQIPTNQIFPIRFKGEILNNGIQPENAWLDVTVYDSGNNMVYQGNGLGTTVAANASIFDSVATFTPPPVVDDYTAVYLADYNNFALDADTTNNYDTASFKVTTCRYARDSDFNTGAGLWNGVGNAT